MWQNTPCRGVLASNQLIKQLGPALYSRLKDLLLKEQFSHGSGFERLRVGKNSPVVFSIRINQKKRLLLTKREFKGHWYWVPVQYLENHKYESSPFLEKGYLNTYFSKESTIA